MYDARGGTSGGMSGQIGFAIVLVVVVVGAFLFAFLMPGGSGERRASSTSIGGFTSLSDLPGDVDFSKFEAALIKFDPEAHERIAATLSSAGSLPPVQMQQRLFSELGPLFADDTETFASIDVRHIDTLLVKAENGLRRASTASNKWCKGATYSAYEAQFASNPELAAVALGASMAGDLPALAQFSVDAGTILLEAGSEARRKPVQRGPLTPQDEAALQGLVFSLIGDPQIMSIMMSAQTGADMDEQLRKLDVCSLGATVLTATRTLPQDTKGRFWASAFRGNSDLSRLGAGTF
ncbi:MAG: hypothetical protein AAFQ84_07185 [Pseudomonadota bacterium]